MLVRSEGIGIGSLVFKGLALTLIVCAFAAAAILGAAFAAKSAYAADSSDLAYAAGTVGAQKSAAGSVSTNAKAITKAQFIAKYLHDNKKYKNKTKKVKVKGTTGFYYVSYNKNGKLIKNTKKVYKNNYVVKYNKKGVGTLVKSKRVKVGKYWYLCKSNGKLYRGWTPEGAFFATDTGAQFLDHQMVTNNHYFFDRTKYTKVGGVKIPGVRAKNKYVNDDSYGKYSPRGYSKKAWESGAKGRWYFNPVNGCGVRTDDVKGKPFKFDNSNNWYQFDYSGNLVKGGWWNHMYFGRKTNEYYGKDAWVRWSGVRDVPNGDGTYNKYYFDENTGVRKLDVVKDDYWFNEVDGVGWKYDSREYWNAFLMEYRNYRLSNGLSEPGWYFDGMYMKKAQLTNSQNALDLNSGKGIIYKGTNTIYSKVNGSIVSTKVWTSCDGGEKTLKTPKQLFEILKNREEGGTTNGFLIPETTSVAFSAWKDHHNNNPSDGCYFYTILYNV